jgi:hypothetical protein
MNTEEQKADRYTTKKYISLMSSISNMEDRLRWSELVYLSLNIVVFLFIVIFIHIILNKTGYFITYVDLALIFSCIFVGIAINAYWTTSSMRVQLKLKLRYFQARTMERKLDSIGEHIYTDESIFFNPDIRSIESHDKKEILKFPTSGFTRMDGFIGSAKPRFFTLLFPCFFIIIYWLIFVLILTKIK